MNVVWFVSPVLWCPDRETNMIDFRQEFVPYKRDFKPCIPIILSLKMPIKSGNETPWVVGTPHFSKVEYCLSIKTIHKETHV